MAGVTDPKTTIFDALLVGNSSFGPVAGATLMDVHSLGVTITPYQNRHFTVITDTAGNIVLDTDDGGNARGDISLLGGTNVVVQYGLNPLTPGSSSWKLFNGETTEYMLEANGLGTLEMKEYIDYVEDGDELWALLSDATERRIYLRAGTVYDLPAGSGTRDITAQKMVIGASGGAGAEKATIRLTGNDYLYIQEQCIFENVRFTENWSGPYPAYLVRYYDGGAAGIRFTECSFEAVNTPSSAVLRLHTGESNVKYAIESCAFVNVPTGGTVYAIYASASLDSWIRDCVIQGADVGVRLAGTSDNVRVENNRFYDTSGSGAMLYTNTAAGMTHITGNYFKKTAIAAVGPAVRLEATGIVVFEGNSVETTHTDDTAWGANYLITVTAGNTRLINNYIKGKEMLNAASGLIGIGRSIVTTLIRGNTIHGGTDLLYGIVIDSEGFAELPPNVQINENVFRAFIYATASMIAFIDSTAGANDWAKLGTISNNIFDGASGIASNAIGGSPPGGQEVTGYTIVGNVLSELVIIQQNVFRTTVLSNNVSADGATVVTPAAAQGDNLVGNNL